MSTCFHPHLVDAERFEREGRALSSSDERIALLAECIIEDQDFSWSLTGDVDGDIIAGRYHHDSKSYAGGIVDVVVAGLGTETEAGKLLSQASCLHGVFADSEPAMGYIAPNEIAVVLAVLDTKTFAVKELERDRRLLVEILRIGHRHRRGLAFIAM